MANEMTRKYVMYDAQCFDHCAINKYTWVVININETSLKRLWCQSFILLVNFRQNFRTFACENILVRSKTPFYITVCQSMDIYSILYNNFLYNRCIKVQLMIWRWFSLDDRTPECRKNSFIDVPPHSSFIYRFSASGLRSKWKVSVLVSLISDGTFGLQWYLSTVFLPWDWGELALTGPGLTRYCSTSGNSPQYKNQS